ncbi:MAG TPA: hypothetical protein VI462_08805 [Acidimicrobiia bacterium]
MPGRPGPDPQRPGDADPHGDEHPAQPERAAVLGGVTPGPPRLDGEDEREQPGDREDVGGGDGGDHGRTPHLGAGCDDISTMIDRPSGRL